MTDTKYLLIIKNALPMHCTKLKWESKFEKNCGNAPLCA